MANKTHTDVQAEAEAMGPEYSAMDAVLAILDIFGLGTVTQSQVDAVRRVKVGLGLLALACPMADDAGLCVAGRTYDSEDNLVCDHCSRVVGRASANVAPASANETPTSE